MVKLLINRYYFILIDLTPNGRRVTENENPSHRGMYTLLDLNHVYVYVWYESSITGDCTTACYIHINDLRCDNKICFSDYLPKP